MMMMTHNDIKRTARTARTARTLQRIEAKSIRKRLDNESNRTDEPKQTKAGPNSALEQL